MLDYQFLGMVAVVLAVVTRGSVLPVVAVTTFIGVLTLLYEAGARLYRRRRPTPAARSADAPAASEVELNRWMAAVERVFRSPD